MKLTPGESCILTVHAGANVIRSKFNLPADHNAIIVHLDSITGQTATISTPSLEPIEVHVDWLTPMASQFKKLETT
jgi:hypothetical protein